MAKRLEGKNKILFRYTNLETSLNNDKEEIILEEFDDARKLTHENFYMQTNYT